VYIFIYISFAQLLFYFNAFHGHLWQSKDNFLNWR